MSKKLTKSIIIYGFGAGLSQSLIIFLLPIYTKVLAPASYGVFELIYSAFLFLNIFGMSQIDSAVSRYYYEANSKEERNNYLFTGITTVTILSFVIAIVGLLMSSWLSLTLFETTDYATSFKIIAITVPVINFYNLLLIITRFDKKPWLFVIVSMLQVLITTGCTMWFLFKLNMDIEGIFWANLIGFAVASIILIVYYRSILSGAFKREILDHYFKFSLPLFPAVVGSWLNNHSSKFLLLLYLAEAEIGIFTAALKVASIFKFGDYIFRMAWTPFYLEEIKKENHKVLFAKIFNYVLLLFGLSIIVLHFIKVPLTKVLFSNPEFYQANEYISLLAFSVIITILVQIVGIGPIVSKKTIYNTYNFIASLVVFFVLFFLLVPLYGINGVIYSQLGSAITLFVVSWYNSNKLYAIDFSKRNATIFIVAILLILFYI